MGVDGCMIRCGKVTYGTRERERERVGVSEGFIFGVCLILAVECGYVSGNADD